MSRIEKQKKGTGTKALTSIIVAIVVAIALSLGGVLAYFTAMQSITNNFTIQAKGKVIIHHYEQGTSDPVAQDEEIEGDLGESFEVTNLMSTSNKLSVGGTELDLTREYLSSAVYEYVSVTTDQTNSQGVVTGTFTSADIEITYYYSVDKCTIDGGVIGSNGTMSNIYEQVISGSNSTKNIVFTPSPGYRVEKIIVYSGAEVDETYGQASDGGTEITDFDEDPRTLVATMDKFTNVTEDKYVAVKFEPRPYVAQIIAVPSDTTSLESNVFPGQTILNRTYYTLEDAITDAALANETTSEDKLVEIILLDDIRNESVTITGENNVSIDLNGHTINSNSQVSPTLTVTESTLIVKDSNVLETGKVISRNGVGIWIALDGELTLGVDDEDISIYYPQVIGKTYGIFKVQHVTDQIDPETGETIVEEGIFNFYDGRITGFSTGEYPSEYDVIAAIHGRVDDTPKLRIAQPFTGENGEKIAYLVRSTNVEAVIGKKTYAKVEKAIEDANNVYGINGQTVLVEMVTDAVVGDEVGKETMTINANRNVVLDLNGKSITSESSYTMFENNGSFTVKDSDVDDRDYTMLTNYDGYGFNIDSVSGIMSSNNKTASGSNAYATIEIDLTEEQGNIPVKINAEMYTTSTGDYGWATITQGITVPGATSTTGRLFYLTSTTAATDYTTTLTGGQKYYLHFGFYQDWTTSSQQDALTINSVEINGDYAKIKREYSTGGLFQTTGHVIKNNSGATTTIKSGMVRYTGSSNSASSYYPINNYGTLVIDGGLVQKTTNYKDTAIYNNTNATMTINGGAVIAHQFTIYNYGTLTMNSGLVYASNTGQWQGTAIRSLSPGNVVINDGMVKGYYGLYNESNAGTKSAIVNNGTFLGTVGLYNGWGASMLEVNNTSNYVSINNNSTCNVNNGKMSYVNNGNGTMNIYGGQISGSGTLIYNNATLNINGTNVNITINQSSYSNGNSSGSAIRSTGTSATTNIDNCDLTSPYNSYNNQYFLMETENGGNLILGPGVTATANSLGIIKNYDYYNNATQGVKITGGTYTVTGTYMPAIYNYSGKMYIGTKNTEQDTTLSDTVPTIRTSSTVGVQVDSGSVYFYDGQIISPIGKTLGGSFAGIEDKDAGNHIIDINISQITESGTTYDRLTLQPITAPVAKIAKTSIDLDLTGLTSERYTEDTDYYYFYTISDAVSVCSETAGATVTNIQIISNILTSDSSTVKSGQNIKIDLNGSQIRYLGSSAMFTNNGTLVVEDVATGAIITTSSPIYANRSNLNIKGGRIDGTSTTVINNTSNLVIDGGTINVYATDNSWRTAGKILQNTGSASCIINGGTFTSRYSDGAIANAGTSTIRINGGSFTHYGNNQLIYNTSTKAYIENTSEPAIYITGGTFNGDYNGINIIYDSSSNSADIWIKKDANSTLVMNCSISVNKANLSIEDATINANITTYGVTNKFKNVTITNDKQINCYNYDNSSAYTELKNCTIYGTIDATSEGSMLIDNCTADTKLYVLTYRSVNLTINDSTISYPNNQALYLQGSGTVTLKGNTTITGGTQYSPTVSNYNGTLTIGEKDGNVSEEYPLIKNTLGYGLQRNSGTVNFYDGRIEGKTGTIYSGAIADLEQGYSIKEIDGSISTTKAVVLRREALYRVAKADVDTNSLVQGEYTEIDANYYGFLSLERAAAACACPNGTATTIELLGNATYATSSTAETIPSGKNLVLDLCGHNITSSKANLFTNNAQLEIIDSSQGKTSTITVNSQNFIVNAGTLNINNIKIYSACNGNSSGSVFNYPITNTGNITFNGGRYYTNLGHGGSSGDWTYRYTMLLNNSGTAQIQNCQLSSIGVYNTSTGNIEVTNVTGSHVYMHNYGTKTNVSGTSESAFKLLSGTFDAYSGIANNAGEFVIDNGTNALTWTGGTNWMNGDLTNNGGKIIINNITIPNEKMNLNDGITEINNSTLSSCEITNAAQSTLNLITGNITRTNSSEAINNKGTVNIGVNDGTIDDGTNVAITGYITSTGTVNFYDGTITATGIPVRGKIDAIPTNCAVINTISGSTQTYSLSTNEVVATIGATEYYTLESAFAAVSTGANTEITLQKNIAITGSSAISITSGKDITLNLNGKKIIVNSSAGLFENAGTFELKDTVGTGNITLFGDGLIANSGALEINGGSYQFGESVANYTSSTAPYSRNIITNTGTGNVTVTAGTFTTRSNGALSNGNVKNEGICILSTGTGDITITGGTFNCGPGISGLGFGAYASVIKVTNSNSANKAHVNIGGTTVFNANNEYTEAFDLNNTILQITAGTINYGYRSDLTSSTATITGGTILGNGEIQVNSGSTLTLDGGTVNRITNYGTFTMDSGRITTVLTNYGTSALNGGDITSSNSYALYSNGGTTTLNSGFSITHTGSSGAIYMYNGTVNVNEGVTITSSGAGVYFYQSNPTLVLGVKARPVSTTSPIITGATYGVNNSGGGTFKFYDGRITGTSSGALAGTAPADVPDGYYVETSNNGTVAYLESTAIQTDAVIVNGQNYATIPEAIAAVSTGTLKLYQNFTLSSPITIPSTKNITIDFNGCRVEYDSSTDAVFINNGTLAIIDTAENGAGNPATDYAIVKNASGVGIENNGTLTIGVGGSTTVYTNSPRIQGATYAVDTTNGTAFNFYDGVLKGATAAVNGTITAMPSGYTDSDTTEIISGVTYYVKSLVAQ